MSAESYIFASRHDDVDDVDSLPSSDASDDTQADLEAQAEWERSIQQLESLAMLVLVPFLGKWMGRQFAYWGWARYMEWTHNVDIVWRNKKAHKAVGAAAAAAV